MNGTDLLIDAYSVDCETLRAECEAARVEIATLRELLHAALDCAAALTALVNRQRETIATLREARRAAPGQVAA